MTTEAKVIAASTSPSGIKITSLQLRYPKCIHGELMTHRVFSRNASSSRAVPVPRLIDDIRRDPVFPVHWGKNQPGMQAHEECEEFVGFYDRDGFTKVSREDAWLRAMHRAIKVAEAFHKAGYHKQIVNRLIEPFSHINVIVTSTDWANFLALRDHPDADPMMAALATEVKTALDSAEYKLLKTGEWHLPYVHPDELVSWKAQGIGATCGDLLCSGELVRNQENAVGIISSVARSARVSYLTYENKGTTFQEDMKLFNFLVQNRPLHASPAEHQATPDFFNEQFSYWKRPYLHGNFRGWCQFRKMLPNECAKEAGPYDIHGPTA